MSQDISGSSFYSQASCIGSTLVTSYRIFFMMFSVCLFFSTICSSLVISAKQACLCSASISSGTIFSMLAAHDEYAFISAACESIQYFYIKYYIQNRPIEICIMGQIIIVNILALVMLQIVQYINFLIYQQPMKKELFIFLCLALSLTITHSQSDDSEFLGDDDLQVQNSLKKPDTQLNYNQTTPSTPEALPKRQFKLDAEMLHKFRYELAAIFAIFLYLIMYRRGKSQNYELIESFYQKTKGCLNSNFTHIGFTKTSGEDPFVAESPSQAMFYASGRENVDYLQIKFNMLKRQDLLYHFIYQTIYPEKDNIIIDIPVQTNHQMVFCIVNKKKLKHVTQTNLDLAKLAGSFEVKGLSSNFHTLSEASQIIDSLLDANTIKKLNQMTSLIHSIHYTDQKSFSEGSGHLRAIFYASQKNIEKYLPALELLLSIVDKICNIKLPQNYKTKALKSREAFNATIQKQKLEKHKQQLKKQKQQKRKQQQAWLRSLPPQKQKKEEQKRKKKEMSKLLKSRVMKVA